MNELDSLRQEAETLKNAIRVSSLLLLILIIVKIAPEKKTSKIVRKYFFRNFLWHIYMYLIIVLWN